MFYIIVNTETPLNGWNKVVTTHGLLQRQVNKQANMMFFNGWWWGMFDNGCEATCTWFSEQKLCDSFASLYFLLYFFSDAVSLFSSAHISSSVNMHEIFMGFLPFARQTCINK